MSDETKFNNVSCCDCGIQFGFAPKIEEMWRKSGKTFYCPNGHPLVWSDKESPEQKENKKLKEEIKELKTKLEAALKDAETQKKKADELALELEIWKPSEEKTA